MIIDSHVHVFPFDFINSSIHKWFFIKNEKKIVKYGIKELLEEMDNNNVEKSVIHALAVNEGYREINDYLSKAQKENKDRFICFGTLNPKDTEEAKNELKRIKNKLNLKGIKLHPTMQQFYPNDEKYFSIYEAAESMRLPVLFHSGFGGLSEMCDKYSEPIYLDEIASRFGNLKLIIGHSGRYFYDQTAMLLRKYNNVYAEISNNLPKFSPNEEANNSLLLELLLKIKKMTGNLDKVFFGSDFPFRGMKETIDTLCSIRDTEACSALHIDFSDIDNILYKNFKNKLGMIIC